jgi:hypothetical protein
MRDGLGSCYEIIKSALLFFLDSSFPPLISELTPTSSVNNDEDTFKVIKKNQVCWIE